MRRRSHPILRESQQKLALVTAHGEETLVGARVVRSFGQEQREVDHFRELTQGVVQQERRAMLVEAVFRPLYDLIPALSLVVIVYVGGLAIDHGRMQFGEFFARGSHLRGAGRIDAGGGVGVRMDIGMDIGVDVSGRIGLWRRIRGEGAVGGEDQGTQQEGAFHRNAFS